MQTQPLTMWLPLPITYITSGGLTIMLASFIVLTAGLCSMADIPPHFSKVDTQDVLMMLLIVSNMKML